MNGQVPQFPGKGGAAQPGKPGPTQAQPGWQNAICPILTAGELSRMPPQTIVQTAGAQPPALKAQACLGPQCMMFIEVPMADGSTRAGCAPVQLFAQSVGLNMMVSEFIMAAKAGAAAEAAERPSAPAVPAPSPLTDAADAAVEGQES